MKMLVMNRKITFSIFMLMVLICGLSSFSYGQEDDALTFSNVTCEASDINFFGDTTVTIKGTILANRGVSDVKGWLTINGTVMGSGGLPAFYDPISGGYLGGHSIGDISEGQTKSFSISAQILRVDNDTTCGYYFEWNEADPPPQTESEVLVVDPDAPPIYWIDRDAGKIKHVILDGSNVEDLVTGLTYPSDIALDVSSGKMYWTDRDTDKIQRANLDGSNVENLVTRGLEGPTDIALDVVSGKIYWINSGFRVIPQGVLDTETDKIQRANLDGSNVENLITQGLNAPIGIALDVVSGKMYWMDWGTDKIQRANLDGSNVEDLVTRGLDGPTDIALDVVSGKMYWTDSGTDKIQRANLDGSNVEDLVTRGLEWPTSIALDVVSGKMYWTDWGTQKIQRANLDGSNVEDLVTGLEKPLDIALGIPAEVVPSTPDLVVEAVEAVPDTVEPGEQFRLYATLRNNGTAESSAATLTYYRSTDAVISTEDTQIRAFPRNPLGVNDTIRRYLTITAPTTPGTYYYGACVDSVTGESNTDNNCSIAVSVTVTAPAEVLVDIPDANLRAKIESALGKTSGATISVTEMETLTLLNAQDASINNLTGLETATNLATLLLGDNSVSDISALAGLTNLTELQLWDNNITNLSSLSGLANLSKLYLWGNSISDISHLSGLINLTQLRLNENSITDISTVSNLTNLTQLYLNENTITDISAVADLTNLTELVIGNNTISDISSVQNLINLEWLDMPNNSISDISAVQNLTSLGELYFQNNAVSDLSPLVANTGLGMDDEIDARGNLLSYPSIYSHIPALQARNVIVDFDNRTVTTLEKISGDTQQGNIGTTLAQPFVVEVQDANSVAFEGVPVTFSITAGDGTLNTMNATTNADGRAQSILTLGNITGINTVDVSVQDVSQTVTFTATATSQYIFGDRTTQVAEAILNAVNSNDPNVSSIADITASHLAGITYLYLRSQNITSLKSGDFSGLTTLETLYLSRNPLSSLPQGIFDDLTALEVLSLSDNQLSSLPQGLFDNLTSLEILYLSDNQLSSLPQGLFDNLTSLEILYLSDNQLSSLPQGIFDNLTSLEILYLSDNQLSSLPQGIFDNLTALEILFLYNNLLTTLPAGIFDNLTSLLNLLLGNNYLMNLPAGIFDNLTSLIYLNHINKPYPLSIGLEKIGEGQFKAVLPTPAPIDLELPLIFANGSINGGVTSITLPKGSTESTILTMTRTPNTTAAVIVDIVLLPSLSNSDDRIVHEFLRSSFPLTVISALHGAPTPVSERSLKILDAIIGSVPEIDPTLHNVEREYIIDGVYSKKNYNMGHFVTEAHLTAITTLNASSGGSNLDLGGNWFSDSQALTELKYGDFDGLDNLIEIRLDGNKLSSIPDRIFDNLTHLTTLNLSSNVISTLPVGIFDNNTNLQELYINNNQLSSLPEGLFDNLTHLTTLNLSSNQLNSLPDRPFHNLTNLTHLYLSNNPLISVQRSDFDHLTNLIVLTLPDDISGTQVPDFSGDTPVTDRTQQVQDAIVAAVPGVNTATDITEVHLAAITVLDLTNKNITELKPGDFDGMPNLDALGLDNNEFTTLPDNIFQYLTNLRTLFISNTNLNSLPITIFDTFTNLNVLNLSSNELNSIPDGIFDNLTKLVILDMSNNQLRMLPAGLFENLPSLNAVNLANNQFRSLTTGIFKGIFDDRDDFTIKAFYIYLITGEVISQDSIIPDDLVIPDTTINLKGNPVDPLPLSVGLEHAGDGQFKAVVPSGAPFDLELTLRIAYGVIDVGVENITIPVGDVESEIFSVSRIPGTTFAVTADIETLPQLAEKHSGYTLVKSDDLPLVFNEFGGEVFTPISHRTPQVVNAIVDAIPDVNSAAEVTKSHLTVIEELDISDQNITTLKHGDFDGLTSLNTLTIFDCELISLPADIFNGLTALETLGLSGNPLTTLPAGIFDGLTSLTKLAIENNQLNTLPLGVFDRLIELISIHMPGNNITSLPVGVFEGLTALQGINLSHNQLTTLPAGIFDGLTILQEIDLSHNQLTTLPAGVFEGLTALQEIDLSHNQLTTLPAGVFEGLTALQGIGLTGNALTALPAGIFDRLTSLNGLQLSEIGVDPLPLNISLEKVADGQFKAVAPAGATFTIVLPISVTNGSIVGGASTITISVGSVESEVLTVTRTPDTTGAVTVNIGALPNLPSNHAGYTLVKSADLPLSYPLPEIRSLLGNRTPQVRDAIVEAVPGVNNAADVTEAHLAAITVLNLSNKGITALKSGDFDGLTALTTIRLWDNELTTLPADIFDGLTALDNLYLRDNELTTLPADIFDGLTTLTTLYLSNNSFTTLPADIFDGLTALDSLYLYANELTTLPAGIFDDITALTTLHLGNNAFTTLPAGIFDRLTSLSELSLANNDLSALPDGIFKGLNRLSLVSLGGNTVDPFPINVSLEKVADGQFKAVAPTGAPFDIVLLISVTDGSISGGTTNITISAGSVESEVFTVSRTTGTTDAVLVDIDTLPELPHNHSGYAFVKSAELPLAVFDAVVTNTAPVFTDGSSTTRSVAENTESGQNIGTPVSAADADSGDTLTYSLSGTDAAAFSIDTATGQLQTMAALDYETQSSFSVIITVSDARGGTDTIEITINITDVAETESVGTDTTTNVCQVGDILTPGQSCTYPDSEAVFSVSEDGRSKWNIPNLPWLLSWINQVSNDDSMSISATVDNKEYRFVATKVDGNSWEIKEIADNRSNTQPDDATLNNAPVFSDGDSTTRSIAENTAAGENIGTAVAATDADSEDTLTYSLTGTDAAAFSIDTSTGQLQTNAALNYETKSSYSVTVSVSDGNGGTDSIDITINITDVSETDVSDQNYCAVGDLLEPGDSCIDPGTNSTFTVRENGSASHVGGGLFQIAQGKNTIIQSKGTINGVKHNFVAERIDGNTWQIKEVTPKEEIKESEELEEVEVVEDDEDESEPQSVGATPTLTVSKGASLTEATLHGSVITLKLVNGVFDRSSVTIRNAITLSGITGVTVDTFGVTRVGDTQVTIELEYEGNLTVDDTLTVSVGAAAIKDYDGDNLIAQIPVTANTESVSASTTEPLTEATLHGSVVTLTLSGRKYASSIDIRNAVSVSGIAGVTIPWHDPDKESDTEATIKLEFDGTNFDTNATLTITVEAEAIAGYNGPALTTQISVAAVSESVSASTAAPLTEAALDGSVITLTLSGRKFERSIFVISDAVSVTGISGVTVGTFDIDRQNDTEITIELTFDGNLTTDGTLTITVGADAIAGYNGPALTTQISVAAVSESVSASTAAPLTEAALDGSVITLTLSGRKFERSIFVISDPVSVTGISGVTVGTFDIDRQSDTEITVELTFDGNLTTDGTLTITVGADAIAEYNGPALTAQVTVTASRENALAANYPNPFNPETWIPYQLSKPADVTLTIYDIKGHVVRTLDLGHQRAGLYQARSRAAHWDGRNNIGEKVASGVYFYMFTAGDFTATRKMLIRK